MLTAVKKSTYPIRICRNVQDYALAIAVALFMTIAIAFYLRYIARTHEITLKNYAVSIVFLTMMASTFNSLSYFLATPYSFLNTVIAVNFSMGAMTSVIVYLLWHVSVPGKREYGSWSTLFLSMLLVWNEFSMGVFLYQITAPSLNMNDPNYFIEIVTGGITSPFFVIPMFVEMMVSVYLFAARGIQRASLLSIAFMSLFTIPMAISYWKFLIIGQTVAMIAFMIWILELVSSKKATIRQGEKRVASLAFFTSSIMMLANFLGFTSSSSFAFSWLPYSVAMLAGMFIYFSRVLRKVEYRGKIGWAKERWFIFSLLFLSFVAEWFISASIIFKTSGITSSGVGAMYDFSAYLGGVNTYNPLSVFLDSLYIIGQVTSGFWFLTIMGIEMGSLVVFRIRSTAWREKRVNLILALIAFAGYTIYIPTIAPSGLYSWLPLWANVGALGPFYPYLIVAVVASYILYALLAILFGRRSYCGTLCPSAVMYGGTLGQQMISYNYESSFSRKNIGSKYKAPVLTVVYNSWIVLFVVSAISFYSRNLQSLTIYGIDATEFYSVFVWNFMWYLFFFSIPFVGMSPCRRYGWCSTGNFVGFFSLIGLFRLKVKSPQTCVTCKTKDCVAACEVGLGDLPGQFISKGFFKSSKCVGSGSCIEACPYENIFFYDVRNYLRDWKKNREGKSNRLP